MAHRVQSLLLAAPVLMSAILHLVMSSIHRVLQSEYMHMWVMLSYCRGICKQARANAAVHAPLCTVHTAAASWLGHVPLLQ
jgi:hypothetical protein